MKHDVWPTHLFHDPNPAKSIEEIWDDINGYTFESMYEKPEMHNQIDFVVPFPPLEYRGKLVKGLFYSQAVDVIIEQFPKIKQLFFPIANSMFAGYPKSIYADCYFTCYKYPKREEHFFKQNPDKKNVILIPLQDADFVNEYTYAPTFNTPKTIDVFCVATLYPVKNIPMIAKAALAYEKKYHKRLKIVHAAGNRDLKINEDKTLDYSKVRYDAQEQVKQVEEILGGPQNVSKYIEYIPYIENQDLSKYYTGAKCCVLTSLLEGKNRFLCEAMSCDTPVIAFKDFNKYARGEHPLFYENSGEYVPEFTPESLADTIHKVITNEKKYETRKCFLKHYGRKNFVNTCIDTIPYYKENIPDYVKGQVHNNIWVDLATQFQYQISFIEFLYCKNPLIHHVRGMKNIQKLIEFFIARFRIK